MTPADLPPAAIAPAIVVLILAAGARAHRNSEMRGKRTGGYRIYVWFRRLLLAVWTVGFGALLIKSAVP
jgi:hypothetical protein